MLPKSPNELTITRYSGYISGDDAVSKRVVEAHFAVLELVFEVDVADRRREIVGDPSQREIVGRHDPDGAARDQSLHHGLRADARQVAPAGGEDRPEQQAGHGERRVPGRGGVPGGF